MKKLMIVAAVAAMVGGAFADTAYTFSATLKTTKGKSGKVTSTYNLGMNPADGKFWYEDTAAAALIADEEANTQLAAKDRYFTTKKVGGRTVPALTAKAKKDADWLSRNIAPLAATYNEKSAGKWCDTFKLTEEGCYRMAGTEKVKDILVGDICCAALVGQDADLGLSIDATASLDGVQRFGGLTYAAAKKAEIFAEVTGTDVTTMYLAGQGSIGKVLDTSNPDTTVEGVTSLSGNIVGVITAPECEFCCSANLPAVAFVCGTVAGDNALDTAAYGTFSIKYNAKATKELL